jgi:hypothetical protein
MYRPLLHSLCCHHGTSQIRLSPADPSSCISCSTLYGVKPGLPFGASLQCVEGQEGDEVPSCGPPDVVGPTADGVMASMFWVPTGNESRMPGCHLCVTIVPNRNPDLTENLLRFEITLVCSFSERGAVTTTIRSGSATKMCPNTAQLAGRAGAGTKRGAPPSAARTIMPT